jgi:hypothetical protein
MNPEFLVCVLPVMFITFIMGGCTSDPYAPVNQSTPIRQMDNAFDPSGSRYYKRTASPPPTRYYERTAPTEYPRGGYESPSYSRY